MKKIFQISIVITLLLALVSCKKEIKITGTPSPLISVEDVRLLVATNPVVLKAEDMFGATSICGIVISDPGNGNAPDGLVIMQSFRRKKLRGIALALGDAANQYTAGDSIVVKIEGGTLERVNGILQISGIARTNVEKISSGNPQMINVTTTTFTAVTNNMDTYESTLVQLKSAVVKDMVLGQTFQGEVPLSDWANVLPMITKPTASFAANPVPGLGDYTGIALYSATKTPTFWLRSAADYVGQSLEPYKPGELYLNFPEGWESHPVGARKSAYSGTVDAFPSGEWSMANAYSISSANIVNKNGSWAVMMRNGFETNVEMNFNLPYGASKFSFYYGAATASATDAALPITVKVTYSQDSGNSWQQLEGDLIVNNQATKYFKEYSLSIKGPVRFRITKDASNARLFIDDIAVYQN